MKLTLVVGTLLFASNVLAIDIVEPGESVTFTSVDGGDRNCRRGTVEGATEKLDCRNAKFGGTQESPDKNRVRARVRLGGAPPVATVGTPHYATVGLFKDIHISGAPDNFVPVQISTVFDYRNFFALGAAYLVSSTVSFRVTDLASGEDVATHTLFETARDGDQGFTDIAFGSERRVATDASGNFAVLLRRGRDYRLTIEIEALSQVVLNVGITESDSRVDLSSITVRIDEDDTEALDNHDVAIKEAISDHDAAISSQVSRHDADIKALLVDIKDGQQEIIRLLLTPQGRRESEQGDFPLKPSTPVATNSQSNNGQSNRAQSSSVQTSTPPPSKAEEDSDPPEAATPEPSWPWNFGSLFSF
jgi:hypothetical protein